jgi:hypothetical protein
MPTKLLFILYSFGFADIKADKIVFYWIPAYLKWLLLPNLLIKLLKTINTIVC